MLPASTNVDAVPHALVHDAARQHALLDGRADAAGAVDGVDRAHVVAMAVLEPGVPVSRSTPSDVPKSAYSMSCTASALPESSDVDPAAADELAEVRDAAGVDDDRPGDERRSARRAP